MTIVLQHQYDDLIVDRAAQRFEVTLFFGGVPSRLVVPFGALEHARSTLSNANVSVEAHARPLLAHSIDMEGIEAAKSFLTRIFGLDVASNAA